MIIGSRQVNDLGCSLDVEIKQCRRQTVTSWEHTSTQSKTFTSQARKCNPQGHRSSGRQSETPDAWRRDLNSDVKKMDREWVVARCICVWPRWPHVWLSFLIMFNIRGAVPFFFNLVSLRKYSQLLSSYTFRSFLFKLIGTFLILMSQRSKNIW